MLTIRLAKEIESRLESLALASGKTKALIAREAILEYLEALENFYLAPQPFHTDESGLGIAGQVSLDSFIGCLHNAKEPPVSIEVMNLVIAEAWAGKP